MEMHRFDGIHHSIPLPDGLTSFAQLPCGMLLTVSAKGMVGCIGSSLSSNHSRKSRYLLQKANALSLSLIFSQQKFLLNV